jgi:uncharacterized protein with PQ loop repeat
MVHGVGAPPGADASKCPLEKILPMLSMVTMVMTLPQIWTIWAGHSAAGVSLLAWGTYLLAACLWFFHGLKKHDKTIYVACIGWILLDAAVVAGILVYG